MDKKTTGIIAYITFIGWLIAFLAGDREGAKFHLNQALVLAILEIILGVLGKIHFWPFSILVVLAGLCVFVLWLMGLIGAIKDEEKPLPLIGGIQILQ